MSSRAGNEGHAVSRLTDSVEPEAARAVLVRCLSGDLAPAAAVAELMRVTGSRSAVREVVDTVTHNAAVASRTGDRLVQDRVDELTQVVLDPDIGVDGTESTDIGVDRTEPTERDARGL